MSTYKDKFFSVLALHSQSKEDYMSEWFYVGGDKGRHDNWFLLQFDDDERPDHTNACICSHPIEENCYIKNVKNGKILVVGNCCIHKFLDDGAQGRTCVVCREPHKNRKDPYCDACRGGIIDRGKHKNKSFRAIFDEDKSYCLWVVGSTKDGKLGEFASWLKKQGTTWKNDVTSSPKNNLEAEVIHVGKHKDKTFDKVYEADRGYCHWVRTTITEGSLLQFAEWLRMKE